MEIKCPLTGSTNIKLERAIKTSFMISQWKESDIDVAKFFDNMDEIYLYKCLDTGYKFYYPFNLSGDAQFYKDLQKFPWYYMDWKWEYDKALELVKTGDNVLEIGCGKGDFIEKLQKNNIACAGLEFSEEAIRMSREKRLIVSGETIQEHAINNKKKYDFICSFQVMEHIAQIGEAIQSSIDALKPNGLLLISVPNNNSFIKYDKFNRLNMPPHHAGRWDEKSLRNLEKNFGIKLLKIYFEPLQSYHYRYYYDTMFGNKIDKIFGSLGKYINIILGRISLYLMVHTNLPKKIKGHTIIAVYEKLNQ